MSTVKNTSLKEKVKGIIDVLIEAGKVHYPTKESPTETSQSTTTDNTVTELPNKPSIISGVQGLADYLGCSKGTAMKIVKSGILPSGKVQYKVGENWKFNRAKLDEFITQNPEILGRKRPK